MLIPKLGKPNLEINQAASSKFHACIGRNSPRLLIVTIIYRNGSIIPQKLAKSRVKVVHHEHTFRPAQLGGRGVGINATPWTHDWTHPAKEKFPIPQTADSRLEEA